MLKNRVLLVSCTSAIALAAGTPAFAQTQTSNIPSAAGSTSSQSDPAPVTAEAAGTANQNSASAGQADIIVTANKREQSVNTVGLTIQAASGEQLAERGIGGPADLAKLVPGFTFTQSLYSTPVFTLRGIGLYDATFGASPSVSVYTDQVPRNVPVMSDALDLDIERVEVLKGPQGTLFGQSSTGGAINYIVAKPTATFHAGGGASYERFDRVELNGFVSGPLGEKAQARLAVKGVTGGAFQRSLSRPDDENGATRRLMGRLTVDLQPTSTIDIELMATGVKDRSDPLAPQYAGTNLNYYPTAAAGAANPFAIVDPVRYAALTNPASPGYDASLVGRQTVVVGRLNGTNAAKRAGARALLGTRISNNARDAEWTQGLLGKSDNSYYQFSGRADWGFAENLKATYIAALAKQKLEYNQDLDGTTAQVVDVPLSGDVKTFNQEARLALDTDTFHGIVGASYDKIRTTQDNFFFLGDYSANADLIAVTLNNYTSRSRSYGLFANGEFKVSSNFTVQGGIRYTNTKQTATYCYNDPAIDTGQGAATLFGAALNSVPITILPGQCFPTTGDLLLGTARSTLVPVVGRLKEDNVSFRVGANYKFDQGALLYATISQGYKAGIFSAIGASRVNQYTPATQEKVVAYEGGFKLPLAGRQLQFNGAAFYYDYSDKQVRGRVQDTVFGLLEKLLNVPKSYIFGLEGELVARPATGLTLSANATYLKSKVTSNYSATPDGLGVYNAQGYTGNFRGSVLPYTPKFSGSLDAQYEFPVSDDLKAFVGGTATYQGRQNTTFRTEILRADDFFIDDYALVDARVGVASADNRWKVTAFGRNLTNKSYVTAVSTYLDTLIRYRGRPVVYGVSAGFNY
jgi:outer membrane receptor protein involved in Fe transport